jgi:hypothetical protein
MKKQGGGQKVIELTKSDLQFVASGGLGFAEEWYYIFLGPTVGAISGVGWAFSMGGTQGLVNKDNHETIFCMAVGLGVIGAAVGLIVGMSIVV